MNHQLIASEVEIKVVDEASELKGEFSSVAVDSLVLLTSVVKLGGKAVDMSVSGKILEISSSVVETAGLKDVITAHNFTMYTHS